MSPSSAPRPESGQHHCGSRGPGPGRQPHMLRERCEAQRGSIPLSNKLYIGNLPFSVTEDELRSAFEAHGAVRSVNVIMDRETGRPRGFAFVEMEDSNSADAAQRALDGSDMGGRSLRVNEANDKRGGGGGGGGRY